MIYVIGMGVSGRKSLNEKALTIINRAGFLLGGKRHLEEFPDISARKEAITGSLEESAKKIKEHTEGKTKGHAVVLATGDPLFFGVAGFVIKKFGKKNVAVIPNVSTVQEAFARIKEDSNGLKVLSAHGRGRDISALIKEIKREKKIAVFTDPENTPSKIAKALIENGVDGFTCYVCESLGMKDERVAKGTLKAVAKRRSFHPLNVFILIRDREETAVEERRTGIPDSSFSHSAGMITKEEIRVVSLSKLGIKAGSVIWDIGAGCGSVSIEAALLSKDGAVIAVEKDRKRIRHIEKNKKAFGAGNLEIIEGIAPECLENKGLPMPDGVFIGGGGSGVAGILEYVSGKIKKGGRVVVNAVTIETANTAFEFFKAGKWERELVLMSVSKGKDLGGLNLLGAFNPVFIITGVKP